MVTKKFLAALAVLAALPTAAHAQQPKQEPSKKVQRLESAEKAPFGRYVTDSHGRTLYMFEGDQQGQPSSCYDACEQAWPPALAGKAKIDLGPKLDQSKLGTVTRRDGSVQLTYGGWPLYYYAKDTAKHEVAGQDVNAFGAEWYLVAPNGNKITTEPPKK